MFGFGDVKTEGEYLSLHVQWDFILALNLLTASEFQ